MTTKISWKSVFAGVAVTLVAHAAMMALGVALGGASASSIIEDSGSFNGLASGAALWIGLSVLVGLAAGSYFAVRTWNFESTDNTKSVGAGHGLVIAAIFFGFMIYGTSQTLGLATQGLGKVVGAVSTGAGNIAANTVIQDTVENALSGTNLKSEPSVVVQGLLSRLISGDTASAKIYLSNETAFTNAARNVGMKTAETVSKTAWTVFLILILGSGMAALSGALGASSKQDGLPKVSEVAVKPTMPPAPLQFRDSTTSLTRPQGV